jgi:hypothetical protein
MASSNPAFLLKKACAILMLGAALCLNPGPCRAGGNEAAPGSVPDFSRLEASDILMKVSALTAMPVRSDVREEIRTREEMKTYILKRIEEEYPGDKLSRKAKIYKAFNLIPREMDFKQFLIQLYTEQAGGLYDPEAKAYYRVDAGLSDLENWLIMAHELTHALQDQNFDLTPFLHVSEHNDDYDLARAAVIEGQATIAMIQCMIQELGLDPGALPDLGSIFQQIGSLQLGDPRMKTYNSAPDFIKATLLFPYGSGASFIQKLQKSGWTWKELGRLYADLPLTTEQILHPDKYHPSRDFPVLITFPPDEQFMAPGWSRIEENILGEYGTYLFLKANGTVEATAAGASAGWDGDRYIGFERTRTGETVLVWLSVWDSEEDAGEFSRALSDIIRRWSRDHRDDTFGEGEDHSFFQQQRKKAVLFLLAPTDLLPDLIRRIWLSEKEEIQPGTAG